MRLSLAAAFCLALLACPKPPELTDSGMPMEDAGGGPPDSGHDAGRTVRDAGPPDAGWSRVEISDWCRSRATAQCWRDIRCGRTDLSLIDACIAAKTFGCDQGAYIRSNMEGRHAFDP